MDPVASINPTWPLEDVTAAIKLPAVVAALDPVLNKTLQPWVSPFKKLFSGNQWKYDSDSSFIKFLSDLNF